MDSLKEFLRGGQLGSGTFILLVAGPLLALLVNKWGGAILHVLLGPFRVAGRLLYRKIAPRNPFNISVWRYRRNLERSFAFIETPIGPRVEIPLERAFVPLRLVSFDRTQPLDLYSWIGDSHKFLVLGGPGTGKTTLMKSLAVAVARRQQKVLDGVLPVFVVLRRLGARQQTVEEAIVSSLAEHGFPGAETYVRSAISEGKLLVVLDGLDETGDRREFVVERITEFCERDVGQAVGNRMIVTCRESSYRMEDLLAVIPVKVRVEGFSSRHMRDFLKGWPEVNGRSALALYREIQNDDQLRDICRTPLLLTLLTGLYLETDNFEIPTSRGEFYERAISELMVRRPARRGTKQRFGQNEKRRLLERLSFARLEQGGESQDPESFSQEDLKAGAAEIFERDVPFDDLIRELVDVDGIVKWNGDDRLTLAHRTIQEYLSGFEAHRVRRPEDILVLCSKRRELLQVMYFYVSLLKNVPQIDTMIRRLAQDGLWNEAGRVLLYVPEPPSAASVQLVTDEMARRITEQDAERLTEDLEVLSSLAQRKGRTFETARTSLVSAIDSLTKRSQGHALAALESVLAASPVAAASVVMGLLGSSDDQRRAAAVRLLRDIGTPEAMDQLVQLLLSGDETTRAEAAQVLVSVAATSVEELRSREGLLPAVKPTRLWPFDDLLPTNIALPILRALGSSNVRFAPFACAQRAHRAEALGIPEVDRRFMKQWRRLTRDMRLGAMRGQLGLRLSWCLAIAGITTICAMTVLSVVSNVRGMSLVVTVKPNSAFWLSKTTSQQLLSKTEFMVDELQRRFPANATGWVRVLPQNWRTEPIIPNESQETFDLLRGILNQGMWSPLIIRDSVDSLDRLEVAAGSSEGIFRSMRPALARVPPTALIAFSVAPLFRSLVLHVILLIYALMFIFMGSVLRFFLFRRMRTNDGLWSLEIKRRLGSSPFSMSDRMLSLSWHIGVPSLAMLFLRAWARPLLTLVVFGVIALIQVLRYVPWPRNPLISLAGAFSAKTSQGDQNAFMPK